MSNSLQEQPALTPAGRVAAVLQQQPVDRFPIAFWQHLPGDDQRAIDLTDAFVRAQSGIDWDLLCLQPADDYLAQPHGLQSVWQGDMQGRRTVSQAPVQSSLDWTKLRLHDAAFGSTGKVLQAIDRLRQHDLHDRPVVVVVYSPFSTAIRLRGSVGALLADLRTQPDRLRSGFNALTDNLMQWFEALRRTAIDGIVYISSAACYEILSDAEYTGFALPYEEKLLDFAVSHWSMVLLQHDTFMPRLEQTAHLPAHAIGWRIRASQDLTAWQRQIERIEKPLFATIPFDVLALAAPSELYTLVQQHIQICRDRGILLMPDQPMMATTPLSNLHAVQRASQSLSRENTR